MPKLYGYVEVLTLETYTENGDGFFENGAGFIASESFLQSAMCNGEPQFVLRNTYRLLQDTYNLFEGSIFTNKMEAPLEYYYWSEYSVDCEICATIEELAQEDWFEQVQFTSTYA